MGIQAKLALLLMLIVGLVSSHWYVYNAGNRNGTNAELVKSQELQLSQLIADKEAVIKRVVQNELIVADLAFKNKQENQTHAQEILAIRTTQRSDDAKRVRFNKVFVCGPGTAGQAEGAKAGGDGQADSSEGIFPESFGRGLSHLKSDAEEVAADLRSLKRSVEDAGCFQ